MVRPGISARRAFATAMGPAGCGPALKQLLGREPTRFRYVLAATVPR